MKRRLWKVLPAVAALVMASLACNAISSMGGSNSSVLEDDFSNTDGNWGTGSNASYSVDYADGGLQMKVFTKNYFVWSSPGGNRTFENIHVETTVINNDTNSTTAFGIICDQQSAADSTYYLAITPAGEYAIAKASVASSDVFLTNNDEWASSDLIVQNAPSYRVSADCGNGTLTLYVDGKQIDSVSDTTYTSGGVGLFTWSGENAASADVTFDDFVVTKLGD